MYNNGNIMVQFSSIQKEKMIHLNKNIYQKKVFARGRIRSTDKALYNLGGFTSTLTSILFVIK